MRQREKTPCSRCSIDGRVLSQIPTAFVYLGCWFLMAGAVYYFLGIETRGKSIEEIDRELAASLDLSTARVKQA
jgi:MFS transporter, putative metabolite:H+ symporter